MTALALIKLQNWSDYPYLGTRVACTIIVANLVSLLKKAALLQHLASLQSSHNVYMEVSGYTWDIFHY